jgi:chain length determinant protein EpsF
MAASQTALAAGAKARMSIHQVVLALMARRRIVITVAGAIIMLTLIGSLVVPKKYSATASVVADQKAPDPISGVAPLMDSGALPSFIATQIDIITSERTRLAVVHRLGLDHDPKAREKWLDDGDGKGTVAQYWAERIGKKLLVKPSRESNVIVIQFTATDPNVAAATANAFATTYMETSSELIADPARTSSAFFEARVREARDVVEQAHAKLSAYQQANGITGTDDRLDVESARLAELSAQLTAVQGQRSESTSRAAEATDGKMATSPDVMQNQVVQGLRAQVALSEARLRELAQVDGLNHPEYQKAAAEFETLKARLHYEMSQVAGSVGSNNAVNRGREVLLAAALEEQKKKVLQLRARHDEIAVLQRDVTAAEKSYDAVTQRLSQTNLASLSQLTNVAMLSEALPPAKPSSPRLVLNLAVATVAGLLLGMWAALLAERFDRRIRTLSDAEIAFGLLVLSEVSSAADVIAQGPALGDRGLGWDKPRRLGYAGD